MCLSHHTPSSHPLWCISPLYTSGLHTFSHLLYTMSFLSVPYYVKPPTNFFLYIPYLTWPSFQTPFNSSALSSCHNRVYQSLANLIRWADQVMLDGIDLEDKENVASVTSVIKAVLDGVKVSSLLMRENVDSITAEKALKLLVYICVNRNW